MWNKSQQPQPTAFDPADGTSPPPAAHGHEKVGGRAVLGPSIRIKGDLSGEEDLIIEGQVEGQVTFKNNTVTIGGSGRVKADVSCKTIIVDGQVEGNLYGEDLVIIRKSSNVQGNAVASRVQLEDGAIFRGSIDMQPKQEAPSKSATIARKVREANAPTDTGRATSSRSGTAHPGGRRSSRTAERGDGS